LVAVTAFSPTGRTPIHWHGGRSPGTNFLWEINGSDGNVVITGNSGHLQYGRVRVQTAAAGDRFLATRAVRV
jgi:hypothetical protein